MDSRATVVIGGGVVGAACAFHLAERGPVLLLDAPRATLPASYGNAGHLGAEQVEPLASPAYIRTAWRRLFAFGGPLDFRLRDADVWAPWAWRFLRASAGDGPARGRAALSSILAQAIPAWTRLAEALGRPELVRAGGHYAAWETAGEGGLTQALASQVGTARVRRLDDEALARVQAAVAPRLSGAIAFEGTGQVSDPVEVMAALRAGVIARGGRLRQAKVARLSPHAAGVELELADGERIAAERVLVAAGVGSRALLRPLGHAAPVIAERGYHIEGPATGWPLDRPIVFEDRAVVVTPFGDRLRATSFVEFGREDGAADPRKWAQLERHARELGLPFASEVARWMGARPTLPDYLPAIGASCAHPRVLYAFGHQHLGLTMAAVTGEFVAALAAGEAPAVPLAPFAIERFDRRTA